VSEVELSVVDATSPSARSAMEQYFAELASRFLEGFDASAALDAAGAYNPPHGVFLLANLDGAAVGCAALQYLDEERAEVKRMWVSPDVRGQRIATRLLAELERRSAESGHRVIVLDTHGSLSEAIALYERRDYVRVERYNDNPHAQLWFRKDLHD
jgi:GNAT superfamily N-acetyltransferase